MVENRIINRSSQSKEVRGLRTVALFFSGLILLCGCSQQFTVSVNSQAVFDPNNRLPSNETVNADLQGCINLAMRQQLVENPDQLTVLSCANSEINSLVNIGQLSQLRFLDLGGNNISNITPLENLRSLGGLNLNDNVIYDVSVLLTLPSLVSVSLEGNSDIPCDQIQRLSDRLGENLKPPQSCQQ